MSRRKGKPTPKARPWVPLLPAKPRVNDEQRQWLIENGFEHVLDDEIWMNDRYVVHVDRFDDGAVHHLSIRRVDRKAARDWRHFQQIKNELAGEDAEAVELYPAEDRLVDCANQFHLWCLPPGRRFPLGFEERLVLDDGEGPDMPGAKQRPIERASS